MAESVPELSGLGILTWMYPPGLVDRVVAACGRTEQRTRLLPARLTVYFVLALALFSPAPYLEVLRQLTEGLRGMGLWGAWRLPAKSSLFRARDRLGSQPLRMLFAATAGPVAPVGMPGVFWRGLRLMAVDGTCWEVADTPANDTAFGRPGVSRGEGRAAFPQVRMVAVAECGTHALCDAEIAGCRVGETVLAGRLTRSVGPGVLVLADREFLGTPLWRAFVATGAHLLWRVPANRVLEVEEVLADGSWISRMYAAGDRPGRRRAVRVRVLAYRLDDPGRPGQEEYRLVTDLLDSVAYPAGELAVLYAERWEEETTLSEIKRYQRGAGVVLASKTPEGVRQQVWAHLLVHRALRALMCQTARRAGVDCDRLSFTDTLRAVRRSVTAAPGVFSP